jgi:hypothetical protein
VTDTPAHFYGAEYQIVSSTGSFTGTWTTGNGDQNGEIVDAIVAAGAGGPAGRFADVDGRWAIVEMDAGMTAPQLAVMRSYVDLHAALRVRTEQLGVSRETMTS